MTGFCRTHVSERTVEELRARKEQLDSRGLIGTLSLGQVKELVRIDAELEKRDGEVRTDDEQ